MKIHAVVEFLRGQLSKSPVMTLIFRCWQRLFPGRGFVTFVRLCHDLKDRKPDQVLEMNQYKEHEDAKFFHDIRTSIAKGKSLALTVNRHVRGSGEKIKGSSENAVDMLSVNVSIVGQSSRLIFEQVAIKGVNVSRCPSDVLEFRECRIGSLHLVSDARVKLTHTCIGELRVSASKTAAIGEFTMIGGCILNIDCPVPGGKNPLGGQLLWKEYFLPEQLRVTHCVVPSRIGI